MTQVARVPQTTISDSRKFVLAAVVVAGWSILAVPAAADNKAMSAKAFLSRIGGSLPEFDAADAAVSEVEADIAQAEALSPLSVQFEREEVFTGGDSFVQKQAISLGWSFDISGRRGLRSESATLMARSTRAQSRRGKQLATLRAMKVYYAAARARLRVRALEQTRTPLAALVEKMRKRHRADDASGRDLARFELALSVHDDRLAATRSELASSERALAALVGEPQARVQATDTLALPSLPIKSVVVEKTVLERDDVRAFALERESGAALVRAANRWWIPTANVLIGYMTVDLGPGIGPGSGIASGYVAMASLSIPIFSRGRAERRRGEARMRGARARTQIAQRQASLEIQTARDGLTSRHARAVKVSKTRLPTVAALVRKTESAYHGGETSALDLRDAYRERTNAELAHIELRYQTRIAQLELWRALGRTEGHAQ